MIHRRLGRRATTAQAVDRVAVSAVGSSAQPSEADNADATVAKQKIIPFTLREAILGRLSQCVREPGFTPLIGCCVTASHASSCSRRFSLSFSVSLSAFAKSEGNGSPTGLRR